ncbi:Cytochrome b-c1 complex subunit 7, mitochondrial [Exophiala xenobiotica]|nr:Cytochrome b-c1 complex subunit 7, mitochondrial [Exophiala xenobiotica]
MVEEMDGAAGQLVRRSCRLQKIGYDITRAANTRWKRVIDHVTGLRADDLIPEENDIVQLALKRLPPKEAYDRVFRLRRAFQASLAHQLLPAEDQTSSEEDQPYLSPIIEEIEAELKERADLESMMVQRKK